MAINMTCCGLVRLCIRKLFEEDAEARRIERVVKKLVLGFMVEGLALELLGDLGLLPRRDHLSRLN